MLMVIALETLVQAITVDLYWLRRSQERQLPLLRDHIHNLRLQIWPAYDLYLINLPIFWTELGYSVWRSLILGFWHG